MKSKKPGCAIDFDSHFISTFCHFFSYIFRYFDLLTRGSRMKHLVNQTREMAVIGDTCKRCKREPTTLASRNDTFCENCFIRFIRGKQRKQMQHEKFKVKFSDKEERVRVLFAMNNDHQSYVLFDILVSMLAEQLTQGPKAMRGFDLVVCVINDGMPIDISKIIEHYTTVEINRLGVEFVNVNCDSYVQKGNIERLKLNQQTMQTYVVPDTRDKQLTCEQLLEQIVDKSTREDLIHIIYEDIWLQAAQEKKCTVLIKSDSMTQMAVDILSDTIRGRGSEIPLKTQDMLIGDVEVIHPLRDILNSEVKMYSKALSLNNLSSVLQQNKSISDVSTKNKTVGEMVNEYFASLEVEYPETVSTVVKIGAKLGNSSDSLQVQLCKICKVPIYHNPKQWIEQITVPGSVPPQTEEEFANFQRYLDSINSIENQVDTDNDSNKPEEINMCYGCMVTLRVSNVSELQWPCRPTDKQILSEYVLDDDN